MKKTEKMENEEEEKEKKKQLVFALTTAVRGNNDPTSSTGELGFRKDF